MKHLAILCLIGLVFTGCASTGKAFDTSQLSPQGLRAYHDYKYIRLINDVSAGVIAGGRNKLVPVDAETAYILIAKQVLDVFAANPVGAPALASAIVKNAMDGWTPELRAILGGFMAELRGVLEAKP